MSRKKRQTVTLLVLCLVLIAAGVGYYALIRHQAAQEKAEKAKESAGACNRPGGDPAWSSRSIGRAHALSVGPVKGRERIQ